MGAPSEPNFVRRAERNASIVARCDTGDSYASVGREFSLTSSRIREIYFKACRKRSRVLGNPMSYDRIGLLQTGVAVR